MKKIILSFAIFSLIMSSSCSTPDGIDSDLSVLDSTNPGNFDKIFDISTNNSGLVKITPLAEGVTQSLIAFGHGTADPVTVFPGAFANHVYPEGNYTVSITSFDIAGHETTNQYPLQIVYRAPENLSVNATVAGYQATVAPVADYANSYLVYYGDVINETPTALLSGQTLPAHTYASGGVYTVTVIAQSGGVATTSATQSITIYDPLTLPLTYELASQNYNNGGTFGGVNVAKVANPFPGGINTSANVWKFTKTNGAEEWGGTYTPMTAPNAVPVNIDNGNKIKVMVYSTEVGKQLHFQLEQGSGGYPNTGIDVASTVANQWEELVFDFGPLGIPAGTTFGKIVFQYNLSGPGTGEVIYIDNVSQSN